MASRAIYARVTMLARLPTPADSATDHLFVGTDQFTYFTLSWDAGANRVRTERNYVDMSDPSSRESQTGSRCLIDPSGRYMTLEMYEGIVAVIPIVQLPSKKRGRSVPTAPSPNAPRVGELGEPTVVRIDELFVRSSAFLHVQSGKPQLALLYEDNQKKVRLRIRELRHEVELACVDDFLHELDLGASHLIPVPAPLGSSCSGVV